VVEPGGGIDSLTAEVAEDAEENSTKPGFKKNGKKKKQWEPRMNANERE